jgi:hypothetical protein
MRNMMKVLAAFLLTLILAITASAQVRGRGRLQGVVSEKGTGKPVVGAKVTVAMASQSTAPIITKTDSHGHWSALGLVSGQWNVDIEASGYAATHGSANVSEVQMMPAIKTELAPEVKEETTNVPMAPSTPRVPKEAIDAVNEGQALLRIKEGEAVTAADGSSHAATAAELKGNAQKAVADFEKALPLIPSDKPDVIEVRRQITQVLAQAYYKAGDVKGAIKTLEQVTADDPANTSAALLLTNLYLEDGRLDQGKALLEKLPAGAVTDPTVYTNIGILFLNKKNPADAATYFGKSVEMDPKRAESYYYRGLAELQLKKNAEAKADFQKVIAIAPDSTEAGDAKQLLASLK